MMNRIIIAPFALAIVQLASSQSSACDQALLDLRADSACNATVAASDSATVCMGSCRALIDNVTSNCDNGVSSKVLIAY